MRRLNKISLTPLFLVALVLLFQSCTDKYPPMPGEVPTGSRSGCVDCHTNKDLLKQVATPISHENGETGEG
ncbi:hypothetical protein L0128_05140 [candidate division KSB1 bacterium]|nr:hypothetical protein [candidate division KSB1 bacterium]